MPSRGTYMTTANPPRTRHPGHLTCCRTAQREGSFVHFLFTYARQFGHLALLALLLPEVWEVDLDAEILFPLAFKEFQ